MAEPESASSSFKKPRHVVKKVLARPQQEGDGAFVRRSIGRAWTHFSFWMNFQLLLLPASRTILTEDLKLLLTCCRCVNGLDSNAIQSRLPVLFICSYKILKRQIFYLQGAFMHQDFAGHKGTIRTGDLQWMTAGRGIIHSEFPAGEGAQKGLQLWINLSAKDKMIEPRYQELQKQDVKRTEKDGVEVRVIAGESLGIKSPVYTRTPTMFLDFTLKPGAQMHQPIPESWNAFVYIIEGEAVLGDAKNAPVTAHYVLVLSRGDGISVWNKSQKPVRFVLIGGQPLNEPVVQYGPFVMNTQAEIEQAIEDYHYSRNGFEKGKQWKSQAHQEAHD
ncbi:Pirin-like protein [Nymphaea thermarum]|nr:Pirin-like protein [Nymphaea thermarum]